MRRAKPLPLGWVWRQGGSRQCGACRLGGLIDQPWRLGGSVRSTRAAALSATALSERSVGELQPTKGERNMRTRSRFSLMAAATLAVIGLFVLQGSAAATTSS